MIALKMPNSLQRRESLSYLIAPCVVFLAPLLCHLRTWPLDSFTELQLSVEDTLSRHRTVVQVYNLPVLMFLISPLPFQSIVIGPSGSTIQRITAEAKSDIEALLKCSVDLTLNVRTRKK